MKIHLLILHVENAMTLMPNMEDQKGVLTELLVDFMLSLLIHVMIVAHLMENSIIAIIDNKVILNLVFREYSLDIIQNLIYNAKCQHILQLKKRNNAIKNEILRIPHE